MVNNNDDQVESPQQGAVIPLDVRCGNCYHFHHQRAPQYADACERLGVEKIGRPCNSFLPDASIIDFAGVESRDLREFLRRIPSNRLSLYAALMQEEKATRRHGLQFGEIVYIRLFPEDYLSNYVRASVLVARRQRIFVQGADQRFRGNFLASSVLDAEEFERKRKALVKRKRLIDPKLHEYTQWRPRHKLDINYEPPVLDGELQATVAAKPIRRRGRPAKNPGMSVIEMRQ